MNWQARIGRSAREKTYSRRSAEEGSNPSRGYSPLTTAFFSVGMYSPTTVSAPSCCAADSRQAHMKSSICRPSTRQLISHVSIRHCNGLFFASRTPIRPWSPKRSASRNQRHHQSGDEAIAAT